MEELLAIKVLLNKSNYIKYRKYLEKVNFERDLELIFKLIKSYYEEYQEAQGISLKELEGYFSIKYPLYKGHEEYQILFKNLESLVIDNEDIILQILNNLIEKYYASDIVESLTPCLSGSKFGLLESVKQKLEEYQATALTVKKKADPFVGQNLNELLSNEVLSEGLKWRLECLNMDVGDLRGGSLGHVYARPDTGKTTFFSSEITHFAKQLKDDEIIVWFNNEEKGSKILLRLYSAILNMTKEEIAENVEFAEREFERLGGHRIKIYDSPVITVSDLEKILKEFTVRLVVVDQGDKLKFSGDKDMATHERLKALYGKLRELAKKYDCDIITAGQADFTSEGKMWLHLSNMDNSKTGKPGELDYAVAIGASFADGKENLRYIHLSKNKMKNGVHGKHVTKIDTLRARYVDLTYDQGEVDVFKPVQTSYPSESGRVNNFAQAANQVRTG